MLFGLITNSYSADHGDERRPCAIAQPAFTPTSPRALTGPFLHFRGLILSSPTLVHATPHAQLTLVVFGRDGTDKPRASWFDAVSADLATKAADPMKMRVLKIEIEEPKALALPLAR